MHICLVLLGLVLIFIACGVSERCYEDRDCSGYNNEEVCCTPGFCKLKKFCERCFGDQDCSSGKRCQADGLCHEPNSNNYYCDGRSTGCLEGRVCVEGKCVSTTSRPPLMGTRMIGTVIIVFVSVVLLIFIIYCLYKRDKKRIRDRVLASRNAWRTTVESRESQATAATSVVTEVDMQTAGGGVSNGGFVIDLEQASAPLPPDAPPPYSSLEFLQQRDDGEDTEQPPPTYDEAVGNPGP